MRILGLDISGSTGWAILDNTGGQQSLGDYGLIQLNRGITDFGPYPFCTLLAAEQVADDITKLIALRRNDFDVIVIEQTNLGKNRESQRFLEFLHCLVLLKNKKMPIVYINTRDWRKTLKIQLTNEDKKSNREVREAKRIATQLGTKVDYTKLKARGKIGKKHLAIRYANNVFGLNLKMKHNDIADAICLCSAYFNGAKPYDGK